MSQEAKAPSQRIAFVGVGRMGSAMLQCVLDAGYRATLCDPSEQATAPFVNALPDRGVAPVVHEREAYGSERARCYGRAAASSSSRSPRFSGSSPAA